MERTGDASTMMAVSALGTTHANERVSEVGRGGRANNDTVPSFNRENVTVATRSPINYTTIQLVGSPPEDA